MRLPDYYKVFRNLEKNRACQAILMRPVDALKRVWLIFEQAVKLVRRFFVSGKVHVAANIRILDHLKFGVIESHLANKGVLKLFSGDTG